jgi:hypothetical protein
MVGAGAAGNCATQGYWSEVVMSATHGLALRRTEVVFGKHVSVPDQTERVAGGVGVDLMALLGVKVVGMAVAIDEGQGDVKAVAIV